MSINYLTQSGSTLQLPNGQIVTLPADTLLTYPNLNSAQEVVENLSTNATNFAANLAAFPVQTVVNGTSFLATYGADASLIVGASVGPTPYVDVASSVRNTTTLTIVWTRAMDEAITNKAGIVVVGDGTTLTVSSISSTTTTMTVTLSGSSSATLMTFAYNASQGTLATAAGALVPDIAPLVIAHS